ncbi:hypothetical protein PR048_013762 [Dryococelus australis]|uniref:Uncharacterized protein n=1 Tax=Dryococelus australis TaxID=614101 RepID=A0ABQ9HT85_9NEOP|nr:hypothetical protein PR048_013762 [Dryococelus australis]
MECKGGRNGRSLRKPADQQNRAARFPHAKIRDRSCRESNPFCLGWRRAEWSGNHEVVGGEVAKSATPEKTTEYHTHATTANPHKQPKWKPRVKGQEARERKVPHEHARLAPRRSYAHCVQCFRRPWWCSSLGNSPPTKAERVRFPVEPSLDFHMLLWLPTARVAGRRASARCSATLAIRPNC